MLRMFALSGYLIFKVSFCFDEERIHRKPAPRSPTPRSNSRGRRWELSTINVVCDGNSDKIEKMFRYKQRWPQFKFVMFAVAFLKKLVFGYNFIIDIDCSSNFLLPVSTIVLNLSCIRIFFVFGPWGIANKKSYTMLSSVLITRGIWKDK